MRYDGDHNNEIKMRQNFKGMTMCSRRQNELHEIYRKHSCIYISSALNIKVTNLI